MKFNRRLATISLFSIIILGGSGFTIQNALAGVVIVTGVGWNNTTYVPGAIATLEFTNSALSDGTPLDTIVVDVFSDTEKFSVTGYNEVVTLLEIGDTGDFTADILLTSAVPDGVGDGILSVNIGDTIENDNIPLSLPAGTPATATIVAPIMDFESGPVSPADVVENGLTLVVPSGYSLNPGAGGSANSLNPTSGPNPVGTANVPVLTSSAGAFDLVSVDVDEQNELTPSQGFSIKCIRTALPDTTSAFATDGVAFVGVFTTETFFTPLLTNCNSVEIGTSFTLLDNIVTSTPPTVGPLTGTLTVEVVLTTDDGGADVEGGFTIEVIGGNPSPDLFAGSAAGTAVTIDAGAAYTVSVSVGPAGYSEDLSDVDCANTMVSGASTICTVVLDDIAPTLKLVKTVTTDDGGDEGPDDWTLSAAGQIDGSEDFINPGGSGVDETVLANEIYNLVEVRVAPPAVPGYTEGPWICNNGGTLPGIEITLSLGETETCTKNNDDIAPTIILNKSVLSLFGGNDGPGGFDLLLNGGTAMQGSPQTVTANNLVGDTINEDLADGYEFDSITDDGTGKCPTALGGVVTDLDEGQSVICLIVNKDIAPTITLVKVLDNGDGGNNVETDFGMFVDGTLTGITAVAHTATVNVFSNENIEIDEAGLPGQYDFTGFTGGVTCPIDGVTVLDGVLNVVNLNEGQ